MAAIGNNDALAQANRAVTLLEELEKDLPQFRRQMLPHFVHLRRGTLETVEELKTKIEYVCTGGVCFRLAGGLAGISGGLASLLGAGMCLAGNPSAASFINTGHTLNTIGTATSTTATLIELGLTYKYMNDVKHVLDKDRKVFESIFPFVNRSRTLNLLLMKLFGYSILSETGKTVCSVVGECLRIIRTEDGHIDRLIREINDQMEIHHAGGVISLTEKVAKRVVECLRRLTSDPELMASCGRICSLLKANPQVFELAKFSLQMYLCMNAGLTSVSTLFSLAGAQAVAATNGALLAKGGMDVIMIALHTVTVVFAVNDIQSQQSKYSEHLDQIKECLSAELKAVTDHYPQITMHEKN